MLLESYSETIKALKLAILASRYKAATLANREMLALYFNVGKLIDEKTKEAKWGDKILQQLSNDLQNELPGLKGFSATNLKRMRSFFQEWNSVFTISPTLTDQLQEKKNKKSKTASNPTDQTLTSISPTLSDLFIQHFFSVSFSHHYEIIVKINPTEERQFYITQIATEFWSLDALKHHLKNNLYANRGALPNNFSRL